MIKTFRGLLADGGQDRIRLSTIKGKVGYRIVKFQVVSNNPTGADVESIVSIWKDEQSLPLPSATIDFTDSMLLATAFFTNAKTIPNTSTVVTIFDNQTVNQDIYISAKAGGGGADSMNYYLELEVIPLDDAGAEYTTLKDMRQA